MRYEIPFIWHTASAKNVGSIPSFAPRSVSGWPDFTWVAIDVGTPDKPDDDAAFRAVVALFSASDRRKRPVSGRSYVKKWRAMNVCLNDGFAPLAMLPRHKVGDRIILHRPHGCAHSDDGNGYRLGVIDEVLSDTHYGIKLDGYPRIADFHIREFAKVSER